jgi:modulator of FtsH protease HflC
MRLSFAGGVIVATVLVALVIAYSTLFMVHQTRQAIVVRFGQPVDVVTDPGLNYKYPLIETVIYIDSPAQELIASDQKRLVVDAFARYKITKPLLFYQTVGSVEGGNARLPTLLNSALRRVLGEVTLMQVVRDQREELMAKVRSQLEAEPTSTARWDHPL